MTLTCVVNRETGDIHIRQKNELVFAPYEVVEMTEFEYDKALKRLEKTEKKVKKERKKEKDEEIIYTSLILDDELKLIVEEVYDEEQGTLYCIYQDNDVNYSDHFIYKGFKYKPIYDEEVQKKAILLPTHAEDYGTEEELDNQIKEFIGKWLDLPDDFKQFALWNIKRSWVYERFHTLNYLRALGDTGQGKSRFLDTLGYLHYKPIATSGATTSAPVFRIIDKWKGTIIMDEADFQKSDEAQDIIKIINQGYEKGRFIMRCDKDKANKVNFFDPFGPKILATRKTFSDKAVESRCITQVMTGTARKDIKWNLTDDFWKEAEDIRNKLLMWRFKHFFIIKPDREVDFDFGDIEPRVQQIVNSFISLFGHDKDKIEFFKHFIENYQSNLIEERQNSWDGQIVGAIHQMIKNSQIDISAHDIVEIAGLVGNNGKPLNPRSLSSSLKSLGFDKPEVRKVDGKSKRCIPLNQAHLDNLFKRYGYAVTVVTQYTDTPQTAENALNSKNAPFRIYCNDRNSVTLNREKVTVQDFTEINQNCHICGQTPSHYFDETAQGKPICQSCKDYKDRMSNMEESVE